MKLNLIVLLKNHQTLISFIIIINTKDVNNLLVKREYERLTAKYDVPVSSIDVTNIKNHKLSILKDALENLKIKQATNIIPMSEVTMSNSHY